MATALSAPGGYLDFCDWLWQAWLAQSLPDSAALAPMFQLDYAPEPYLCFDDQANPLVVLTTNPGGGMPHQHRQAVLAGASPISNLADYATVARRLAEWYAGQLGGAAGRRIAGLCALAHESGYSGVLQVECIPFHSAALPGKSGLLRPLHELPLLQAYMDRLHAFLRERNVFVLSAVSSRHSLDAPDLQLSSWLTWQLELVGLRRAAAELHSITSNGAKTTAAALVDRGDGAVKSMLLMMGGNHLPAAPGRARLARLIGSAAER